MQYEFDTPVNRRGTDSYKWDIEEKELPMWVADMDFQTAPEIREALQQRVEHGIFGYSIVPEEWYQAYQSWWQRRHDFAIEKEWLIFCTGAIPAISTAVRKLTTPAEQVVTLTPVYNIFFNSILNNGRRVLECPLAYDGTYSIDFEDLERKLAQPQTTMLIFCNPHNPVGKIWTKEELAHVGALCKKHHVIVISDELHCDLTEPGKEYVPFASASEECREVSITCLAPTKTFNLAGLQTAAVMIPNELLRHKMWRALNTDEVAEPNAFAVPAAVAAFQKGEAWLDALREYIEENKQYVGAFIEQELPQITLLASEATYLLWLDCSQLLQNIRAVSLSGTDDADIPIDSEWLAADIRKETGLYLSDGKEYGGNGTDFLRMNIACPRSYVEDGLHRLRKYVGKFAKK
jgi:cystathionine beta-lyase